MFSVAPKHVELTIVPKKGRKNKEVAFEHFEESIQKIKGLVETLDDVMKDQTTYEIRKPLRGVLREILREVKEVQKLQIKYKKIQYKPKRTRKSHNTGLEKLRPISESMALFAEDTLPECKDWEYGVTQKSRYDVTNLLCAYIKENGLRDPDNKTIITPDAKLKELLQLEDDVVLKYPTMQKYLKNCFEEVEQQPDEVVEEKDNKRGRKVKETKVVEEATPKKPAKKEKETAVKAKKEPKKK